MEATPTTAPAGFVPFPEATVTEAQLASVGFPVTLVLKSMGTKVVAREGVGEFSRAVSLAKRAGFVRWSTCAEWEAAVEARLSKATPTVSTETLEFLTSVATAA